jgi:hypothetical protein
MPRHSGTVQQRIEAKTVQIPEAGCWIFTGALDTSGYGLIGLGGSGNIGKAHRESYKIYCGEIPDGMQICHRCDVRCCVNPHHLFVGTLQDNMDDRGSKGRHVAMPGMTHGMHKLTDAEVISIRREYAAGGIGQRALGRKYGVTKYPIQRIVNGTGWKHLLENI